MKELVASLKNEVIGITDALAPPDEVLASPMGAYDGDVYNKYLALIYQGKSPFERVSWW
jgi:acyl-CoA oxidase